MFTSSRSTVNSVELLHTSARFVYGASIEFSSYEEPYDSDIIRGLPGTLVEMPEVVVPQISHSTGPLCRITVPDYFPPGSILIFEVEVQNLDDELVTFCTSDADKVFGDLGLVDLNVVLYRADGEERDATMGEIGVYQVPDLGKLMYCGLEGWMHPLRHIMRYNDLGHPLCENLRKGLWALDYIHARLEK